VKVRKEQRARKEQRVLKKARKRLVLPQKRLPVMRGAKVEKVK
jgi:hypothetical protein